MTGPPLPLVVLALAIDVALGAALLGSGALAGRPVIVGAPAPAPVVAPRSSADSDVTGVDATVRARLTADDVARGVWALATDRSSPGLTAAQRAALGARMFRGATLRATLGEQRMSRRAQSEAWVDAGRALALALHAERMIGQGSGRTPSPARPAPGPPARAPGGSPPPPPSGPPR